MSHSVFSAKFGSGKLNYDNDGVPILVEVSKVTVRSRPMTSTEIATGVEDIIDMIKLLKTIYEKGKAFYEKYNIKGAFKAAQGVGSLISGIRKFIPEGENPIVKNLQMLEDEVKQLGEKMTAGFDELKSFMTELKFFVKVTSPISVLTKHLRNCLKNPGPEAVGNFRKAYQKHSPLSLLYTVASFLEQKSTNPIKFAMDVAPGRRDVIEKWDAILKQVLGQLVVLEAFATGLLEFKTQFNSDLLIDESINLIKIIDEIKEEYLTFMEEYIPSHTHLNNGQKADEIAAKLNTYKTSDAFYIAVFNVYDKVFWDWQRKFAYNCKSSESQVILLWEQGLCNAFIYRSYEANYRNQDDYEKLKGQVKGCQGKMRYTDSLEMIIKVQLLDYDLLPKDGFICLANESVNLQVRNANCPEHEWGPGWYDRVGTSSDRGSATLTLMAAFS